MNEMPFIAINEKPKDSCEASDERYVYVRKFGLVCNSEDLAKLACEMLEWIFKWAIPVHDVIIRTFPFIEHRNIDGVDCWQVSARFEFDKPSTPGAGKIIKIDWSKTKR